MATTTIQRTFCFDPPGSLDQEAASPHPPRRTPVVSQPAPPAANPAPASPRRRAPQLTEPDQAGDPSGASPASPPPGDAASDRAASDRAAVLRRLRAKAGCVMAAAAAADEPAETITSGCATIDAWLPQQGLRLAALTEWIAGCEGSGAAALALVAAAEHLQSPRGAGPLVVIDRGGTFYPPAAIALGIPAERIIWCRPSHHRDLVWSIDQALRCESVAAVFAHVGLGLDDRDARRFQLAAETGRTPGLLVRPAAARGRPTFAETRFHVAAEPRPETAELPPAAGAIGAAGWTVERGRTMRVSLDRTRGAGRGQSVTVAIDERGKIHPVSAPADPFSIPMPGVAERSRHETVAMHLASQLADPASLRAAESRRRRGA